MSCVRLQSKLQYAEIKHLRGVKETTIWNTLKNHDICNDVQINSFLIYIEVHQQKRWWRHLLKVKDIVPACKVGSGKAMGKGDKGGIGMSS